MRFTFLVLAGLCVRSPPARFHWPGPLSFMLLHQAATTTRERLTRRWQRSKGLVTRCER